MREGLERIQRLYADYSSEDLHGLQVHRRLLKPHKFWLG